MIVIENVKTLPVLILYTQSKDICPLIRDLNQMINISVEDLIQLTIQKVTTVVFLKANKAKQSNTNQ